MSHPLKRQAPQIVLSEQQQEFLTKLVLGRTTEKHYSQRASIILGASKGVTTTALSKDLGLNYETVKIWRRRWYASQEKLSELEGTEVPHKYHKAMLEVLTDQERPGAPCKFTAAQVCQIIALACESPGSCGYPVSHWSNELLAKEAQKRGIVEKISATQVGRFLKSGGFKTA